MSLSKMNRPFDLKSALVAVALPLLLIVGGCQVRPLYATSADAQTALKSIMFSEADSRVELEVRNQLIFMTSGGAGEPANPEYDVQLTVVERNVGVLLDLSTDLPRAGRIILKADFTLKRTKTGEVLKTGHRSAVALVDFPGQEYAKLRATREAENRAARELAELIRADLASWLGR
ncbi:MAG: lipopolysaccharide-assembly family protein [Rhizobium sp.]|nr:lipopolysaccharide-assembly family protein [Rhizobium sp.]